MPKRFRPYIKDIILPDGMIQARWERLAERILEDYANEDEIVMIVLMNGGYKFFEDLKAKMNEQMRYLDRDKVPLIRQHFVRLQSYVDTATTGEVKGIELLEALKITGKNVLLVEDMIDSGTTMKAVLKKIETCFQPKSLRTAIAFHKMTPKNVEWGYFGEYTGFLVEEKFVIGYGMDYNELFRDLPHLCEINQHGIDTYRKQAKD